MVRGTKEIFSRSVNFREMTHSDQELCGGVFGGGEAGGCAASCEPCSPFPAERRGCTDEAQVHEPVLPRRPRTGTSMTLPSQHLPPQRMSSHVFDSRWVRRWQAPRRWWSWRRAPPRVDPRECLWYLVDAVKCTAGEVTSLQPITSNLALQLAVGSFGCAAAAYKLG